MQGSAPSVKSPRPTPAAASNSASSRGLSSLQVRTFSSTCSSVLMPERTTVTPLTPCKKRKAKPAGLSSGRRAASFARAPSGREASFPPRTGSMTQTGTPREFKSFTFSSAR